MQTLWRAFSQNLSFSLHVLVGTFAILRPSQNPSAYLQITYRSPPQARKPGILTAAPPSLLKLREPASRPSDCLTVEKGAGPAPRPLPAHEPRAGLKDPYLRRLLIGSWGAALRALSVTGLVGGGSTTSHGLVNGVWGTRSVW